jgi:DNA-binding XRE family transcriptional regulator
MKQAKRQKLRDAGYRVTDTKEFLGLSDSEAAVIELKIALVQRLREARVANSMTQTELAKLIKLSQSRIAKMEAASADVTIDLIIKALFALGVTPQELGKTIEQHVEAQ